MSGRVGTTSLATSCDITRHHAIGSGSGSGAGGVRCHSTEGIAEESRGGGSGSGSGRRAGVGSGRGSPYTFLVIFLLHRRFQSFRTPGHKMALILTAAQRMTARVAPILVPMRKNHGWLEVVMRVKMKRIQVRRISWFLFTIYSLTMFTKTTLPAGMNSSQQINQNSQLRPPQHELVISKNPETWMKLMNVFVVWPLPKKTKPTIR